MRVLDLYCGAGGAGAGYARVPGTTVIGVDLHAQPAYPFPFIQADALRPPLELEAFDLVHASPPCQAYTTMNHRWPNDAPDLIDETRDLLAASGVPYVIESVPGAVRRLNAPVTLTGEMFGLGVHRARLFELGGWWALGLPRPPVQTDPAAVYGREDGRRVWTKADGTLRRVADLAQARAAMEIPWMDWDEIRQAIPPAYTEYLGAAFLAGCAVGALPA